MLIADFLERFQPLEKGPVLIHGPRSSPRDTRSLAEGIPNEPFLKETILNRTHYRINRRLDVGAVAVFRPLRVARDEGQLLPEQVY